MPPPPTGPPPAEPSPPGAGSSTGASGNRARSWRGWGWEDAAASEALEIAMGLSLPSRRVTRALDELVAIHGCPSAIRVDNGEPLQDASGQPLRLVASQFTARYPPLTWPAHSSKWPTTVPWPSRGQSSAAPPK